MEKQKLGDCSKESSCDKDRLECRHPIAGVPGDNISCWRILDGYSLCKYS